ncbi:MAG: membrane protein YdbS with pleckstrin-like domain [Planctomycetota bacterium]|jgi:membrane protein YdbS with pleckstrin-like domain
MTGPESLRPPKRLAARVVPYWILGDGLTSFVLTGLAWFLGRPWLSDNWEHWTPMLDNVLLGLCLGALTMAFLIPPLNYARWRYGFVGDLLLMRYGILFVEERAVPVRRMQHVDLVRGPIERAFGLATLVVFTAGNEGSAFRVPGLPVQEAQELRDRIVQMRGDGRL